MRKIAAFYYLNYPNNMPSNPLEASSEVYVEVGEEDASPEKFEATFSFQVYTTKYLLKHVSDISPIISRSVIIVERFDDKIIRNALMRVLNNIEEYGKKIGV